MAADRGRHLRILALLFLAVFGFSDLASAQGRNGDRGPAKLDRVLGLRARQLWGRSRVIVEFHGSPDVRAVTAAHGVASRRMRWQAAHVAEINNTDLMALARDPRVKRVMADRPAFATLERTAASLGFQFGSFTLGGMPETGYGVGIAFIDSGVNAAFDGWPQL